MTKLSFSFDIGHASLGWAVLDVTTEHEPRVRGCGTVLFPTDDCLASTRRQLRRQRRHIRSTRLRIARMKQLLAQLGVLSQAQLDVPGGPWPWRLAARVHAGGAPLSWPELWEVLRWYAHNRGYDGNRMWSRDEEEDAEDTAKVKTARALLERHGKETMCETICARLKIDPLSGDRKTSPIAYKTSNAAFPREIVHAEVVSLLRRHVGVLPQVTETLITALCAEDNAPLAGMTARQALAALGFQGTLPGRFAGGLLFGVAVPRFDNRIIGTCPVSGKHRPLKNCKEYLEFRWAEILANVKVRKAGGSGDGASEPRFLDAQERAALTKIARDEGGFTAAEFKKAVLAVSGAAKSNAELMMTHPDAQEALVLDPALRFTKTNGILKAVWAELPVPLQKRTLGRWNKGRRVSLAWLLDQPEAPAGLEARLQAAWQETRRKPRKGEAEATWPDRLRQGFAPGFPGGRAPYSREVMKAVAAQVAEARMHPRGNGGVLDAEKLKQQDRAREIDDITNNHLVRHRLKILLRLVDDLLRTYADGDAAQVHQCVVEVARDLVEFSGKDSQQMKTELGIRLKNFKEVSGKLEEDLEGTGVPVTAGLIRKGRIADDLGWTCPYTGQKFSAMDLARGKVDKDHIIPRSLRPADSLDSLVITYDAVNRWKANRTARQFVEDEQGKTVPGMDQLSIVTLKQYEAFVAKLAGERKPNRFTPGAGALDDKLRQWKRKQLLLLKEYEEREFTPRDLTVTSHLVRLAARQLEKRLAHLQDTGRIVSLPGSVTGMIRKAWNCLGCLAPVCPEVMEMRPTLDAKRQLILKADGTPSESLQVRPKGEIRDITHLHHALDACVVGLVAALLPNDGKLWEQLVTRKVLGQDEAAFRQRHGRHGLLKLMQPRPDPSGKRKPSALRLELQDLPRAFKQQMVDALKEGRVVQHVPADMSGARLELNTWRVLRVEGEHAILRQRTFGPKDIDAETGARKRIVKEARERVSKLVGLKEGKLSRLKGALVIGENYGVVLDPQPVVIPFHDVKRQVGEMRRLNGGRPVRVLRVGMRISVKTGNFAGVWRIRSVSNGDDGIKLDMTEAQRVQARASGTRWSKREVSLQTLIRNGLEVASCNLCGGESSS